MTLVVREKRGPREGSSGWAVVIESTGEVILTTAWGRNPGQGKPWSVSIPWPGFRRDIKVADEAASVVLAEAIYRRIAERLALAPPASDSHASVSPEQTPSPAADSAHSGDQCTDGEGP